MINLAIEDLDHIATLPDGWDGEGALAPQAKTIENARTFLRIIRPAEPDVTPTNNGTVDIEWEDTEGYVHLEVGLTRFAMYVTQPGQPTRYLDGEIRNADHPAAH